MVDEADAHVVLLVLMMMLLVTNMGLMMRCHLLGLLRFCARSVTHV
jgi:hypothetical protein